MKTYIQLYQELDSYSRKFLANQLSKWQADQIKYFDNLDHIFKDAISTFSDPNRQNQFTLWTDLDKTYRELNDWINKFFLNPDIISNSIIEWQDQIQHFFSSFPKNTESTLEDEFWQKEDEDGFLIKLWKY